MNFSKSNWLQRWLISLKVFTINHIDPSSRWYDIELMKNSNVTISWKNVKSKNLSLIVIMRFLKQKLFAEIFSPSITSWPLYSSSSFDGGGRGHSCIHKRPIHHHHTPSTPHRYRIEPFLGSNQLFWYSLASVWTRQMRNDAENAHI